MKTNWLLSLLALFLSFSFSYGQSDSRKKERQERTVDTTFTKDEKNTIHYLIYDTVKKMNLDQNITDQYYAILYSHTYKMTRLDDKDQDLTPTERKESLSQINREMNAQLKEILSEENYNSHLDNFNTILKAVYLRAGWQWDAD